MAKIVGLAPASFTIEGKEIKGTYVHTTEPLDPHKGRGQSVERLFLSEAKAALLDFVPNVGQKVTIFYNRYGKLSSLRLENSNEEEVEI